MRRLSLILGLLAAVGVAAVVLARPDRPLRIGVGVVAHDLCSKVFVSGLDPQQVFTDSLAPRDGLKRIAGAIRYKIDRPRRRVDVRLAGVIAAHAIYYDGLGCLLIHGPEPRNLPAGAALATLRPTTPPLLPEIAAPEAVTPRAPALISALDHAFEESATPPYRRTKAVVIVHDGRVVAERYAPGYTTETPILGFSMTKSVINALVGILVHEGRLAIEAPAPVAAWKDPADPRHPITVEALMRMTSGLDLDEEGAGPADPSDRMFYLARDMSAYAQSAHLKAAPGARWAYSSASTHILAQIVRDRTGGGALDALGFAQHDLFGPLGMRSALMEVDATGTMIGAHYMFASARDWARFGLLYLNDGVVGGQRLLPEGWIDYSTRPTLHTDYGAGFWTNRGESTDAAARARGGMPHDAFYASGNLGQRIVIIPSQRLVIVRLGDATGPGNDMTGLLQLVRETIKAVGDMPAVP